MKPLALLLLLAANSPFYKDKTMPGTQGTISCCKKKDCSPILGWRYRSGNYELLLNQVWHRPPQHLVVHVQTPDGLAHACYRRGYQNRLNFFCVFIPVNVI